MANLAAAPQVAAELGRSLTASEQVRVDVLLARVSAYIRHRTGRAYTPGTATYRGESTGLPLELDDATAVSAVRTVVDGTPTTETGYVLRSSVLHLVPEGTVEVDYTSAGTIPAEVRDVAAALTARVLDGPEPWVTGVSIDDASERYGDGFDPLLTTVEETVLAANSLRRFGATAMSVSLE